MESTERTMTGNPVMDRTSLGNVLLSMNAITKEDLFRAISSQTSYSGGRLGNVLIELGIITNEVLERAMEAQRIMRGTKDAHTELDAMGDAMRATRDCTRELSGLISRRKRKARQRGEISGRFLTNPGRHTP